LGVFSFLLFSTLWWLMSTSGDDAPWLPAGLVASLVMVLAAAVREAYMRRAWARYIQHLESEMGGKLLRPARLRAVGSSGGNGGVSSVNASASALRALQQRIAETEARDASHAAHLNAYHLCRQYIIDADDAIRLNHASTDVRFALRAGQERVRELQKHHFLMWTRGEATRLTHEAQKRVRQSDKIETAERALDVIGEALHLYPDGAELRASERAVRDFIAFVKVAHWVEIAERAAFRGKYVRAIARYGDALFYLLRADMSEDARAEATAKIEHEIKRLRVHLGGGEKEVSEGSSSVSA